jgi:Ca2+-binding EF-hand superfamily protein
VQTIEKILKSLKQPFTDDQIAELINHADVDEQRTVDYREFVRVMLEF